MCLKWFVNALISFIVKFFFRDLSSFNEKNIPPSGPVIFVCAPHANQFIDPMIVQECSFRNIGFLAAKKSVDRKYVGKLIKAMNSIPVMRPQDYMKRLAGSIHFQDTDRVIGNGTSFLTEFASGESIYHVVYKRSFAVKEVVSDTELILKKPLDLDDGQDLGLESPHKSVPKIDQSDVYDRVFKHLADGHCLGIFPEGGSHDRTSLLPLKAGVTMMALGAMSQYKDLDVTIVPVGLYYYQPHKFRSSAVVDFGNPFIVDRSLVELYEQGGPKKRAACGTLLQQIQDGLAEVTVQADTYQDLQLIRTARRLYQPKNLGRAQQLELTRRMSEAFYVYRDDADLVACKKAVEEYMLHLKEIGLKDHQVEKANISKCHSFMLLVWRIIKFCLMVVLASPGVLLYWHVGVVADMKSSEKARDAVASSTVKIRGADVVATWKVMIAMVLIPLTTLIYAAATGVVLGLWVWKPEFWIVILISIGTLFLYPLLGYTSVRFYETGSMILFSLQPLFLSLCGTGVSVELLKERNRLREQVAALIHKLGPEMLTGGDRTAFENLRIVKESDELRMNIEAVEGAQEESKVDEKSLL